MDDSKIGAVRDIIAARGAKVLDEPQLRWLLSDTKFLSDREKASMWAAVELGIPKQLLLDPEVPVSGEDFAKYVGRLSRERAINDEDAREAVELWARALGREPPAETVREPINRRSEPKADRHDAQIPPGRSRWFGKIGTKNQALQVVQDVSMVFFIVGGLQVLVALLFGPLSLVDAAVFGGVGAVLRLLKSRVAAVALLVYSALSVLVMLHLTAFPVISLIALAAAIRGTDATFKLHRVDLQTVG